MRTAIIALIIVAASGCKTVERPVAAIIDCGKADQAQLEALALQLAPLLSGATIDWGAIAAQATHAGATIGGCAFAALIEQYLGGTKAVSVAESHNAHDVFEAWRRDHAGGATFLVGGRSL